MILTKHSRLAAFSKWKTMTKTTANTQPSLTTSSVKAGQTKSSELILHCLPNMQAGGMVVVDGVEVLSLF